MDSFWFWLVNKCVFIAVWSTKITRAMWFDCLRVARIYIVRASYIVFLFVKTENNNFIKEIKHVIRASIACWKHRQGLWEFSSRWKPSTAFRVFTDLISALELSQTRLWRHGKHVLFLKWVEVSITTLD